MSPTRMARIEAAPRTVIAFNEALNRQDVAGMMRLLSDDCALESADPAPDGTSYRGKEAVTRYWEALFRESPHIHIRLEEVLGLGLRCLARWQCCWTDASGEERYVRGVDIVQVKAGLICEQRTYVKGTLY